MPATPADPDSNGGYDTEDEELEPEYPYGHGRMTMQQDDLDKNRYRPSMGSGINGLQNQTRKLMVLQDAGAHFSTISEMRIY